MTIVLPATDDAIRQAAAALRAGGLVAFPTETVYGLGADAENGRAVAAMFAAKGRPADHPVIVHLADASRIDEWASDVPDAARALAAAFWPGPLTMILRRTSRASDLVTGGLDCVGLRVPGHPVAQQLLREFGGAIAAPSANRFGRVSPTTAAHVLEELGGRIDLILDGGRCDVGLESTIVDLTSGGPRILRPGGITEQQIADVLGSPIAALASQAPRVSGSLESHYAPRARVELWTPNEVPRHAASLAASGLAVAVLAPPSDAKAWDPRVVVLPVPPDHHEYAQQLYALLRQADACACDVILACLPEGSGIAVAIADRLRKAAGPREATPETGLD
jgi:L-threonylcarbamoyladenylate synthase